MDDQSISDYAGALANVAAAFHLTLAEHGPTPAGVSWADAQGQSRRFGVLCAAMDPKAPLVVNDVGCGYGALFPFLRDRFDLAVYCGTDVCESMVEAAISMNPDPRARFVQSAVPVTVADWSVASGIFNLSLGLDPHLWRRLAQDVLGVMAGRSLVGFAFNMLGSDQGDDLLWGSPPEPWLAFCRDELGGRPTLVRHDGSDEWTMRVLRG